MVTGTRVAAAGVRIPAGFWTDFENGANKIFWPQHRGEWSLFTNPGMAVGGVDFGYRVRSSVSTALLETHPGSVSGDTAVSQSGVPESPAGDETRQCSDSI